MLKLKKICTVFLAVGTITAMSLPALAAEKLGRGSQEAVRPDGSEAVRSAIGEQEDGDTTVSIFVARQHLGNVSFTVPLTVTMAVEEGQKDVYVPDSGTYSIANTSKAEGSIPPFDIAVVKMEFKKLKGSSYNTVEGPLVTGNQDILFQIGKVTMPALSTPGESKDVTLRAEHSQFLEDSSAEGYAASKWKRIAATPGDDASAPTNKLMLDLKGTVAETAGRSDRPSVGQFQVTYILSPLSKGGVPLGRVYAGNNRADAGLEE